MLKRPQENNNFADLLIVNHSLHFMDPITHVDSNNIESRWRSLRHMLSRGEILQNQVDSHIYEYLWHRGVDPFQELIEDIKTVYPV